MKNAMNSLNKVTAGILAAFFALAIMLAAHTAEAGAVVNWKTTKVTTERGKCIIRGYFYNTGDKSGNVDKIKFTGNVAGIDLSATTRVSATVGPNGRKDWSFTIVDSKFTSNSNPKWSVSGRIWWN